jgi:hypothetical protein
MATKTYFDPRAEIAKLQGKAAKVLNVAPEAQVSDTNVRLEHLSKRMDEAENLLKRIYDHLRQFHRI